jgi:hypothetical protein
MFYRILLAFLVFICPIKAQKLEAGIGIGPTFYKGDLQPSFRPFSAKAASNLFFRYNSTRVFSFKINGMYGFVGGNDRKSGDPLNKNRDLSFNNTMLDYNAQAEYNFLNFRTHNNRYEYSYTPYLFGGLGQAVLLKSKYTLKSNDVVTFGPITRGMHLFYGVGYKRIFKNKWNMGLEFGARVPLAKKYLDELDGFGYDGSNPTIKYDFTSVTGGQLNLKNNPNTLQRDKYFYLSLSISYLHYKLYCPTK